MDKYIGKRGSFFGSAHRCIWEVSSVIGVAVECLGRKGEAVRTGGEDACISV